MVGAGISHLSSGTSQRRIKNDPFYLRSMSGRSKSDVARLVDDKGLISNITNLHLVDPVHNNFYPNNKDHVMT